MPRRGAFVAKSVVLLWALNQVLLHLGPTDQRLAKPSTNGHPFERDYVIFFKAPSKELLILIFLNLVSFKSIPQFSNNYYSKETLIFPEPTHDQTNYNRTLPY